MMRFEKDGRFWEIDQRGSEIVTRSGVVGRAGKQATKQLPSPEAAEKNWKKRARATEKRGFALVEDGSLTAQSRNLDLEHGIIADPHTFDAYLVYADWLQSEGDVRGELAAIQHAQESQESAKLAKLETKLIKGQGAQLLPPRVAAMLRKRRMSKDAAGFTRLSWRCGFIASAHIGRNSAVPPYTVRELTGALLQHPSARFLSTLEIGALFEKSYYSHVDVVDVIAHSPLPALRKLVLCNIDPAQCELAAVHLGELGLLSSVPRLEELSLRAGTFKMTMGRFANLRHLSVTSSSASLAEITAELPILESLRLSLADGRIHGQSAEAFFGRQARTLTSLSIVDCSHSEILLEALLRRGASGLLTGLRHLDLSRGTLQDEHVEKLLAVASTLQLETLILDGNHLSDACLKTLGVSDVATNVDVGVQRKPTIGGLNENTVRAFADNGKTMTAARKLAMATEWNHLGFDDHILWGDYTGRDRYEVYANIDTTSSGCTCPSPNTPCKHATGLLLMAAQGQDIPNQAAPHGIVERCDQYTSSWE